MEEKYIVFHSPKTKKKQINITVYVEKYFRLIVNSFQNSI